MPEEQYICTTRETKPQTKPITTPLEALQVPLILFLSTEANKMASHPSKTNEFERIFNHLDKDGDGKLSPAELQLCMKTIGEEITAEDAKLLVESMDSDGDGLLGFEEFMGLMERESEEVKDRELRQAFKMYEDEGLECITAESLKRMLSQLGTPRGIEECRIMICRFDLNGDGMLCFEEFKVMML